MRRPWMVPLVPVYLAGAALRALGMGQPRRLGWPVVSVGNLSAGGTGKTPFTIALAGLLKRGGFAVDVLSRGYGRRGTTVERVDPAGSAGWYGDEPLLIAREAVVPVYVGARRWEAGKLAEAFDGGRDSTEADGEHTSGAKALFQSMALTPGLKSRPTHGSLRIHLLDDGFQHRQLYRDVDIVLVNSEDLRDSVLPGGNLREPLGALRRTTVFALAVEDDGAVERLRAMGLRQPVWRFRREMAVPKVDGPVYAFCGIARPEQFFLGLERAGMTLAGTKVFRDHHRYGVRDIRALKKIADRMGASGGLVTTEKDRVRMGALVSHLGDFPLWTVGLRIELEDEAGVATFLRGVLNGGDRKPGL